MKKLIPVMCALSMLFTVAAKTKSSYSGKGVSFTQTSLTNAIQLAKAQNKLIFIEIYTTWCGPCIMLRFRTFSNKEAGQFFNENFINLSLDGEKGEGLKLFQAYRLTAVPTLIILDNDGTPLLGTQGYMDAKTLIEFGRAGIAKSVK
jgi:thiol:disulfide interchange protein